MADLPKLAEPTQRKLALKWSALLEAHCLTGEHLQWHERELSEQENNRAYQLARRFRVESQNPHARSSGSPPLPDASTAVNVSAADHVGIDSSIAVAQAWFAYLASEYRKLWLLSGPGYELLVEWLDLIKGQVSAEVQLVWTGGSETIGEWYARACGPAVDAALADLVVDYATQARDHEISSLEGSTAAVLSGFGANGSLTPEFAGDNTAPNTEVRAAAPTAEESRAGNAELSNSAELNSKAERRAAVRAYKAEGRAVNVRIFYRDIAKAADENWNDRTPVDKWIDGTDPRYNGSVFDRKIRRVLHDKPHLRIAVSAGR